MVTPQEVKDSIVFGGLYKVKGGTWNNNGGLNDQCYYLAVPIHDDNGDIWMQDTYQIEIPSTMNNESMTDAAIRQIISFGNDDYKGWAVKHARSDYYYKNQLLLQSMNDLKNFIFVADLHDYRGLKYVEDKRDYLSEDLIYNVKLYFEHGYSWDYGPVGVILIRKDAKESSQRILERCIQDIYSRLSYPSGASSYYINQLDDAIKLCEDNGLMTDELEKEIDLVMSKHIMLQEMYDKIKKLN